MDTIESPTIPHDHCGPERREDPSYAEDRAKILARLKRIEGQVRGIERMVEDGTYCVDVLTQISAVIAGLRSTGMVILEDHVRGCVINAAPEDQDATVAELIGAIERFNRNVGS